MIKTCTILAVIFAALTLLLSVLPISNLAIFPGIAALIFTLMAFYLSKKTGEVKKIIQFTFFLTISALAISTYKAFFTEIEVASTEVLDAKEDQFEEEAIEELEGLEIENIDMDAPEIENLETQNSELEDIQIKQ
ncbi:FUSC family protein [Mariniflexile sp.]|uniref:FUSC family protein n=1 Tax=Mariniflexile sp. TaxID=1979402 RepID=UPI004048E44C